MANFEGLNIDANVEESTGSKTIIPAGKYKACLVADELKNNSKGTGKILTLQLQILDTDFAGLIVKDNLNITNPSPTAQAIGQGTLKRICNLCKVQFPPRDTAGLMGKPMMIDVVVESFKSDSGNDAKSNKIKAYNAVENGQQPAQSAQSEESPSEW
jgi:hypothetical protein